MNAKTADAKGKAAKAWHGRTFYRYRIPEVPFTKDAQILRDNLLYFSSPSNFNDPDEARPHFRWGDMSWATINYFLALLRKRDPGRSDFDHFKDAYVAAYNMRTASHQRSYIQQMEAALTKRFQGSSICCFCESADNAKLWEDYANNGSGYCVGFSFEATWTYNDVETTKDIQLYPYKVTYQDEYPVVDADCIDSPEEIEGFVCAAILTKASKWSKECEWRCFRPSHPSGLQSFPSEALTQVVLGAEMNNESRDHIVELARRRATPTEVLQAVLLADGRIKLQAFR